MSMDLYRVIRELVQERDRLDRIIQSLETEMDTADENGRVPAKRRGRKSMDGPARKEVSERMRRYWAKRREQQNGPPARPSGQGPESMNFRA